MGKITFIIGGARSGKSTYAIELAKKLNKKVAFIATCLPRDREMKNRIELHKKKRPSYWKTFEEPIDIFSLLKKIGCNFKVIIIDCLTLLISNLLSAGLNDNIIEKKIDEMTKILKTTKYKSIIVSNEVGLGIVPKNDLARRFRDLAGRINQIVTKKSNDVFFMVSGLPLKIKGERR